MKRRRMPSGLMGWEDRLRAGYADLEDFKKWDAKYSLASRLGFSSAKAAWEADPTIQGSIEPHDFALVSKYPRRSFEERVDLLIPPEWQSVSVVFHELIGEAGGGWSVNDSWFASRKTSRDRAIEMMRDRWGVFKANYASKARIINIDDHGDDQICVLTAEDLAFAVVEVAS